MFGSCYCPGDEDDLGAPPPPPPPPPAAGRQDVSGGGPAQPPEAAATRRKGNVFIFGMGYSGEETARALLAAGWPGGLLAGPEIEEIVADQPFGGDGRLGYPDWRALIDELSAGLGPPADLRPAVPPGPVFLDSYTAPQLRPPPSPPPDSAGS
eukprot:SAG22_NODE_6318_length_871_cov_0.700777_1_plen_153_part_00